MSMDCHSEAGVVCEFCGLQMPPAGVKRNCGKFMESLRPPIALPRVSLGAAVEQMLLMLGITKERVQAWTRMKDCGCPARQRWLDQWGYAQQEKLERVLNKAARFYFGGSLDAPATVASERDANAPQAAQGEDAAAV